MSDQEGAEEAFLQQVSAGRNLRALLKRRTGENWVSGSGSRLPPQQVASGEMPVVQLPAVAPAPCVWAHLQARAFPSVQSKSTRRHTHCSSSASVPRSGWRAGCHLLSSLSFTPASEHGTPSPLSLVLLGLLVLNQQLSILVKSILTFPRYHLRKPT